jgi:HPt (histidine-containing phosphotransfer) domain-containing protein
MAARLPGIGRSNLVDLSLILYPLPYNTSHALEKYCCSRCDLFSTRFAHLGETVSNATRVERRVYVAVRDFDETVLVSLQRLGGIQLAQRMLALFLEHTPKRLETVRVGLQEGDLESVRRAAHSLKSTSGHLRIVTMQALAETIEGWRWQNSVRLLPGHYTTSRQLLHG